MYTQLGVLTKGTIVEANVSELGMVTAGGKVVFGKYAQITNNPENDGCINAVLRKYLLLPSYGGDVCSPKLFSGLIRLHHSFLALLSRCILVYLYFRIAYCSDYHLTKSCAATRKVE